MPQLVAAIDAQLRRLRPGLPSLAWSFVIVEKRATYACTPDRALPGAPRFAPGDVTSPAITHMPNFPPRSKPRCAAASRAAVAPCSTTAPARESIRQPSVSPAPSTMGASLAPEAAHSNRRVHTTCVGSDIDRGSLLAAPFRERRAGARGQRHRSLVVSDRVRMGRERHAPGRCRFIVMFIYDAKTASPSGCTRRPALRLRHGAQSGLLRRRSIARRGPRHGGPFDRARHSTRCRSAP